MRRRYRKQRMPGKSGRKYSKRMNYKRFSRGGIRL